MCIHTNAHTHTIYIQFAEPIQLYSYNWVDNLSGISPFRRQILPHNSIQFFTQGWGPIRYLHSHQHANHWCHILGCLCNNTVAINGCSFPVICRKYLQCFILSLILSKGSVISDIFYIFWIFFIFCYVFFSHVTSRLQFPFTVMLTSPTSSLTYIHSSSVSLWKKEDLLGISSEHTITTYNKFRHKHSHQGWMSIPSTRQKVLRAGESIRDNPHFHSQKSHKNTKLLNHTIYAEAHFRPIQVLTVSLSPKRPILLILWVVISWYL